MKFTWDPKKALANLKKHKISFEEAVSVFYDPLAKITPDPDHSQAEDRLILIGHSAKHRLIFVVHVFKEPENTIRIISARLATKRERLDFENL
jgi:uncharacterized DUF497 family protein